MTDQGVREAELDDDGNLSAFEIFISCRRNRVLLSIYLRLLAAQISLTPAPFMDDQLNSGPFNSPWSPLQP